MAIRIRYIDPVGGEQPLLQPLADYLASVSRVDTELEVVSLANERCRDHLEYHSYEAVMAGDIVRAVDDAARKGFDATVIGCFYDPSLLEAREVSGDMLVVGPCQASLETLANLGNKFSVIVGRKKWICRMEARIREYGYHHQLASFRSIEASVEDLQQDEAVAERIFEAAQRAVEQDGAEVLLLGCTMGFGFYKELQARIGVPVIDCALAAFKRAEQLAELKQLCGWKPSRVGSCESPPEHEMDVVIRAGSSPLGQIATPNSRP